MSQIPPSYGGDPDNPYGQQTPDGPQTPQQQQAPYQAQPPPPDPHGEGEYPPPRAHNPRLAAGSYGYPVQYAPPAKSTNNLALASMICGIAGLVLMWFCGIGFLPAVAAVVLGFVGRSQINQAGGTSGGAGLAMTGIITGCVAIGLSVLFLVFWIGFGILGSVFNHA